MQIHLDMYQTLAIAVVVLMLGQFLKQKIHFLEKFCVPAPVVGGLLFAIFTCVCFSTGVAEFSFDDTLREVCMVFFFTSVGFQANLKVLKSGGKSLFIFLILVIVLILSQNFLAIGMSSVLGLDPLIGMCTGSIPMIGGHGTAGAFGPVLEHLGVVFQRNAVKGRQCQRRGRDHIAFVFQRCKKGQQNRQDNNNDHRDADQLLEHLKPELTGTHFFQHLTYPPAE